MQLSRHADYALRVVLDLAPNVSSRIADIARRRGAPSAFLAKIVRSLVRAGLLRSVRGRHGGVSLARPASRITVLQVIEAVDGPLALNRCVPGGGGCLLSRRCPAHPLWMKLQKTIADELRAVTIESLLREADATWYGRDGAAGCAIRVRARPVARGAKA
jgi:Rrf2 family protein